MPVISMKWNIAFSIAWRRVLRILHDAIAGQGRPGLGTCMGSTRTEALFREAGFTRFEQLDTRTRRTLCACMKARFASSPAFARCALCRETRDLRFLRNRTTHSVSRAGYQCGFAHGVNGIAEQPHVFGFRIRFN